MKWLKRLWRREHRKISKNTLSEDYLRNNGLELICNAAYLNCENKLLFSAEERGSKSDRKEKPFRCYTQGRFILSKFGK